MNRQIISLYSNYKPSGMDREIFRRGLDNWVSTKVQFVPMRAR